MAIITVRNYPNFIDPLRSKRYTNRHTPAAVAGELGIPQAWIWFWIWSRKLKASHWLGKAWVNLDRVREVTSDVDRAELAFEATSERIRTIEGAEFASEYWPETPPGLFDIHIDPEIKVIDLEDALENESKLDPQEVL